MDVGPTVRISGRLTHFVHSLFLQIFHLMINLIFVVVISGLVKTDFLQGYCFINQLPIFIFSFGIPIVNAVPWNSVNSNMIISQALKKSEICYKKQHNTTVKCIQFKDGEHFQLTMNTLQKNKEIVRVVIFNSTLEISDQQH